MDRERKDELPQMQVDFLSTFTDIKLETFLHGENVLKTRRSKA
jgi:hypothetical protein